MADVPVLFTAFFAGLLSSDYSAENFLSTSLDDSLNTTTNFDLLQYADPENIKMEDQGLLDDIIVGLHQQSQQEMKVS